MSKFQIVCPSCEKRLTATSDMLGKSAVCPYCKRKFDVPPTSMQTGAAANDIRRSSSYQYESNAGRAPSRNEADSGIRCERCGASLSASARFCASCGETANPLKTPAPAGSQAGLGRRMAAAMLDEIIVGIGAFILSTPLLIFLSYLLIDETPRLISRFQFMVMQALTVRAEMLEGLDNLSWQIIALGITALALDILIRWLYYAEMESSSSQATVGKMALGLVVTDSEGRRLRPARATARFFSKYISAATLMIGFLMAAFTPRRQALHDMIASTLVEVKTRKQASPF